jgi:hypothetical protein
MQAETKRGSLKQLLWLLVSVAGTLAALVLIFYALFTFPFVLFALAVASFIGFGFWERRKAQPVRRGYYAHDEPEI